MKDSGGNSYDQIPYMSISHSLTHPDAMATIGTLLGLRPPNVQKCSVLELGCADGSNLIPMAMGLPESEFFGLDFSGVQIDQGQQAISKLGLTNINLKQMDIMDVEASLGRFDYIIVHGIFSWVPDKVRDKIFSICNHNLAAEGIAYISYNTLPGWYLKKAVRDMMLYHIRKIKEPRGKIEHARNFINFMATSAVSMTQNPGNRLDDIHAVILKHENKWLTDNTDTYMFHEDLEENNDPMYFYQFAEWAGRHELQYLSEVEMDEVFMHDIPVEIRNSMLAMADDLIELEQYRDFLMNRFFRRTLLVHHDLSVARKINPDRLSSLFAGSNCLPFSSNVDISSRKVEQFVCSQGAKLATDHPVTKAAMLYLSETWPQVVTLDTLLEKAYERLRQAALPGEIATPENAEVRSRDLQVLKANLLQGFIASSSLVELHVHSPGLSTFVSDCPVASPWARYRVQAEAERLKASQGDKPGPLTVTNLRHERIELEGITPYILYHLDGKCSRVELLARLEQYLEDGSLQIHLSDEDKTGAEQSEIVTVDIDQAKKKLAEKLDEVMNWLAKAGLLLA
jgi:methyltransferase-like protein/cyclopropane fatty-acyl-phospholipid synthase-like methyltransferase